MDSSGTIDFALSGKIRVGSHARWAELIWRLIEDNASAFKHFLGFCPLEELYVQGTNGCSRTVRKGAFYPDEGQRVTLHYPPDFFRLHCKELAVLEESIRVLEGRPRTEVHEQWSVLVTRDAQLLASGIGFTRTWVNEDDCTEEVQYASAMYLPKQGPLWNKLNYRGSQKILSGIVEFARMNYVRREEMAKKALQVFEKFHAVSERIELES